MLMWTAAGVRGQKPAGSWWCCAAGCIGGPGGGLDIARPVVCRLSATVLERAYARPEKYYSAQLRAAAEIMAQVVCRVSEVRLVLCRSGARAVGGLPLRSCG